MGRDVAGLRVCGALSLPAASSLRQVCRPSHLIATGLMGVAAPLDKLAIEAGPSLSTFALPADRAQRRGASAIPHIPVFKAKVAMEAIRARKTIQEMAAAAPPEQEPEG